MIRNKSTSWKSRCGKSRSGKSGCGSDYLINILVKLVKSVLVNTDLKKKFKKKEIEAMKKNEFIVQIMMQRCIEHSFFNVSEDYISVKKLAEKIEKDGIFDE